MKKKYVYLYVMVLVFASLPLLGHTVFRINGHDLLFHIQRILSTMHALSNGEFPVRIYREVYGGYGYGAPLFYPQLFLYIPALLYLLGCPVTVSYNLFLILVNVVTLAIALYSYTVISQSREVGILGAVLYELSVYRLIDMYTRASIGELLALAFCPLVLCGLTLIKRGKIKQWWVLVLGVSGILQSHILTFVMMMVVAILYVLFNMRIFLEKTRIVAAGKAALVTVFMNLWFLLPFLQVYSMPVKASTSGRNFWSTGVHVSQLFDLMLLSPDGIETNGAISNMLPKTPGMPLLIGSLLLGYILLSPECIKGELRYREKVGCLSAGVVAVCMAVGLFPWGVFERFEATKLFFQKFQFMFRFNVIAVLFLSLAAAWGIYGFVLQGCQKEKRLFGIILLLCIYSLVYTNGYVKSADMLEEEDLIQGASMDELYIVRDHTVFERDDLESNADIDYTDYRREDTRVEFRYFLKDDSQNVYIDVPMIYYPGYKAYVDGEPAKTELSEGGVVRVLLPEEKKEGWLTVEYEESRSYRIADLISLISIVGFLIYLAVVYRRGWKHFEK